MLRSRVVKSVYPYLLAAGDLALVLAGFLLAFCLRFFGPVPAPNWESFLRVIPWVALTTIVLFAALGLYQLRRNGFASLLRCVVTGIFGVLVATAALTFWFRGFAFPRSVLLLAFPLQVVLVCAWRYFSWQFERWLFGRRKLLVVGPAPEAAKVLGKLFELPRGWFEVQRVLAPGELDALPSLLPRVDAVLVVPSLSREEKAVVLARCLHARREAYLVPDLYDIMLSRSQMLQIDDLPVVEVQDIRLTWLQQATKRVLDLVLAGLGLLLSLPVLAACALAVAVTSPGPVLYRQERVGYRGRPFLLYKFRTMVVDAEEATGPVLAGENDSRVTRVGRFLRSTRLDELPQLFNVLKGEMSVVGPRPERPFFVNRFTGEIPEYRYRHLVKPGLTGLAQVFGRYTTSAADKLRYDLYYIRNYSLWLDLKIILQTIPVVLGGEGARGQREEGTDPEKLSAIHTLVNSGVADSGMVNRGVVEGARQAAAGKEGQ
ncbi:MAG: sugar transferase [Armatimonadetes bacterium]|nr:sugar transferase [Armatimonadota bacterium]